MQRGLSTLSSFTYGYSKFICAPNAICAEIPKPNSYTGQLTSGNNRHYAYDNLGRLSGVWQYGKTGSTQWHQGYSYDDYGNRTSTTSSGTSGKGSVPRDGATSLSYNTTSNRITTAGYSYDPAGNQTATNNGQRFTYDAAGRLVNVKNASGVTLVTYTYGSSNRRLIAQTGDENSTAKTYYVWHGDSVIAEYSEPTSAAMPNWSKNYIYMGSRLLSTEQPNGTGGELVQYHHPDRLGTRLVTNNADSGSFTQTGLPFGTALDAESTGTTNRRFTSYDRSSTTGLDYAVNRTYDPRQGRFTQPDPIGMSAVNLSDPQSLNMYSYVGNDPVNRVDPDGQFWGALFRFFAGLFSSLRPNIITGSFTFGNHPPISVSFTPNFQNIGVGYGSVGVILRSDGQWLPELLSKVRETLRNPECAEFAKSILNSVANKKNPIYPAGGTLADVFEAFLNQPKTHELFTTRLPSGSLGYGNPIGNIRESTGAIALPGIPTADGVIGELFHLAGRNRLFDDKQLADAVRLFPNYASVADAALDPLINIYDPRYKGHPDWTKKNKGAYSAYFHYAQYNICKTGQPNEGLRRLVR